MALCEAVDGEALRRWNMNNILQTRKERRNESTQGWLGRWIEELARKQAHRKRYDGHSKGHQMGTRRVRGETREANNNGSPPGTMAFILRNDRASAGEHKKGFYHFTFFLIPTNDTHFVF